MKDKLNLDNLLDELSFSNETVSLIQSHKKETITHCLNITPNLKTKKRRGFYLATASLTCLLLLFLNYRPNFNPPLSPTQLSLEDDFNIEENFEDTEDLLALDDDSEDLSDEEDFINDLTTTIEESNYENEETIS